MDAPRKWRTMRRLNIFSNNTFVFWNAAGTARQLKRKHRPVASVEPKHFKALSRNLAAVNHASTSTKPSVFTIRAPTRYKPRATGSKGRPQCLRSRRPAFDQLLNNTCLLACFVYFSFRLSKLLTLATVVSRALVVFGLKTMGSLHIFDHNWVCDGKQIRTPYYIVGIAQTPGHESFDPFIAFLHFKRFWRLQTMTRFLVCCCNRTVLYYSKPSQINSQISTLYDQREQKQVASTERSLDSSETTFQTAEQTKRDVKGQFYTMALKCDTYVSVICLFSCSTCMTKKTTVSNNGRKKQTVKCSGLKAPHS